MTKPAAPALPRLKDLGTRRQPRVFAAPPGNKGTRDRLQLGLRKLRPQTITEIPPCFLASAAQDRLAPIAPKAAEGRSTHREPKTPKPGMPPKGLIMGMVAVSSPPILAGDKVHYVAFRPGRSPAVENGHITSVHRYITGGWEMVVRAVGFIDKPAATLSYRVDEHGYSAISHPATFRSNATNAGKPTNERESISNESDHRATQPVPPFSSTSTSAPRRRPGRRLRRLDPRIGVS